MSKQHYWNLLSKTFHCIRQSCITFAALVILYAALGGIIIYAIGKINYRPYGIQFMWVLITTFIDYFLIILFMVYWLLLIKYNLQGKNKHPYHILRESFGCYLKIISIQAVVFTVSALMIFIIHFIFNLNFIEDSLVALLIISIFLILIFLPGVIILGCRLSLSQYIAVNEYDKNPINILRRSWYISHGYFTHIFFIHLIHFLLLIPNLFLLANRHYNGTLLYLLSNGYSYAIELIVAVYFFLFYQRCIEVPRLPVGP